LHRLFSLIQQYKITNIGVKINYPNSGETLVLQRWSLEEDGLDGVGFDGVGLVEVFWREAVWRELAWTEVVWRRWISGVVLEE
jgi:hypothetical protein